MAELIVPRFDPDEPWPTLGPALEAFITERFVFGPGSLGGEPAKLDEDKRSWLYALYEVHPKGATDLRGQPIGGRRRHKRGSISVRKGLSKTEMLAWIAGCELHPEAPVRCDGFDANGQPVGRPVRDPYIPLLAVTVEQVEELAYGALLYMMQSPGFSDGHLFDATLDRIIRLGPGGRKDGECRALSNSPGARDGARTTFQGFDEPHRLFLERAKKAHETMLGNMSKRPLEDPWSLYVGTAGEPGQGSIAEDIQQESEKLDAGKLKVAESRLWSFYRWADGKHNDLATQEDRIGAVIEATGDVGEYGPGQFDDIAANWTREGADKNYLERVWLNRWTRSNEQAFDKERRTELLTVKNPFLARRPFVTAGFDGARFRDSTAIVLTDIPTGIQMLYALWERQSFIRDPNTGELVPWEINEDEVTTSVETLFKTMEVWRFNGDPPHWTETMGTWAGKHPEVEEWWTARTKAMALAVRNYRQAMDSGAVGFLADEREYITRSDGKTETYEGAFARHMSAAGKNPLGYPDDDGTPLFILRKLHPTRTFDAQMAAILSWEARLEALKQGAEPTRRRGTRVKKLH